MLVKAVKTNCCGKVIDIEDANGLIHTPNILDILDSFTTVNPEKTQVHFCIDCYMNRVNEPANRIVDKTKDMEGFKEKLRELTYIFKKSLFKIN